MIRSGSIKELMNIDNYKEILKSYDVISVIFDPLETDSTLTNIKLSAIIPAYISNSCYTLNYINILDKPNLISFKNIHYLGETKNIKFYYNGYIVGSASGEPSPVVPTPPPTPLPPPAPAKIIPLEKFKDYEFRYILLDNSNFSTKSSSIVKCDSNDCDYSNAPYDGCGNLTYNIMQAYSNSDKKFVKPSKVLIHMEPDMFFGGGCFRHLYSWTGSECNSNNDNRDCHAPFDGGGPVKSSLNKDGTLIKELSWCQNPVDDNGYLINIPEQHAGFQVFSGHQKWYILQQLMMQGYIIINLFPTTRSMINNGYAFGYKSKGWDQALWDSHSTNFKKLFEHIWLKKIIPYASDNLELAVAGHSRGAHQASGLMNYFPGTKFSDKKTAYPKITKAWLNSGGSMNCFTDQKVTPACPKQLHNEKNDTDQTYCCDSSRTEPIYDKEKNNHPSVVITSLVDSDYLVDDSNEYTITDNDAISLSPAQVYWKSLSKTVQTRSKNLICPVYWDANDPGSYPAQNSWCKDNKFQGYKCSNKNQKPCNDSNDWTWNKCPTHSAFTYSMANEVVKFLTSSADTTFSNTKTC